MWSVFICVQIRSDTSATGSLSLILSLWWFTIDTHEINALTPHTKVIHVETLLAYKTRLMDQIALNIYWNKEVMLLCMKIKMAYHDSGINLGTDQSEAFTSSHLEERQRSHQSCTSR